ncbi:MAG: isopenicillin N synthase family oxygenase, partial [Chlamydiia bacterium]|nr:isopenicillin N synthase family oxygenase [Chlamydiia bacterium]
IKLFHALEKLMVPLQETLAVAIGQPKDAFYAMTQRGNCVLRSIYYPPNPPKNTIWAAEHTDINLFTILPRATAKGLQVKTPDGQWKNVQTPKDAVIINAGDMLAHLSNGEVRAGPHRVKALGEGYERVSMVFFVHPTNETDLTPNHIALNRTGGTAKKASGRAWEVFAERIVENGLASEQMKRDLGRSGYLEKQLRMGNASIEAMKVIADSGNASPEVLAALESRG